MHFQEAQPDNHPCSTSSQNGSLLFLKVPTSAFLAQLRDSLYRLGQYNLCSADNDQKMHFNHKYIVLEHCKHNRPKTRPNIAQVCYRVQVNWGVQTFLLIFNYLFVFLYVTQILRHCNLETDIL